MLYKKSCILLSSCFLFFWDHLQQQSHFAELYDVMMAKKTIAMMVLWEINILINLLWSWCVITINNYHRELDKYIAILNIQSNNNIYCKTVFSCHSCMSAYKNGRQQLVVVMIKYFF